MHSEKLIETIKKRREELKVTQANLHELSGVSLRTLKQLESGKGNPTIQTINKIADVLGLEVCLQLKKLTINK